MKEYIFKYNFAGKDRTASVFADNEGAIPPEAWEYMQATFDRAVEETNLFENLWSNL